MIRTTGLRQAGGSASTRHRAAAALRRPKPAGVPTRGVGTPRRPTAAATGHGAARGRVVQSCRRRSHLLRRSPGRAATEPPVPVRAPRRAAGCPARVVAGCRPGCRDGLRARSGARGGRRDSSSGRRPLPCDPRRARVAVRGSRRRFVRASRRARSTRSGAGRRAASRRGPTASRTPPRQAPPGFRRSGAHAASTGSPRQCPARTTAR